MGPISYIIKTWKVWVVVALVASLGATATLWTINSSLRGKLKVEAARYEVLTAARAKDAVAAKQFIEATQAANDALLQQLTELGDIQDAAGKDYLNTVVPGSVSRLLSR